MKAQKGAGSLAESIVWIVRLGVSAFITTIVENFVDCLFPKNSLLITSLTFLIAVFVVWQTPIILRRLNNARVRKATSPRSLDPREELKDFSPLALSILHRAKVSGRPIRIIKSVVGTKLDLDGVRCDASSNEIQDAVDFLKSRKYIKEDKDRVEYDPARPVYFPTPSGRDLIENSGLKSELPRR